MTHTEMTQKWLGNDQDMTKIWSRNDWKMTNKWLGMTRKYGSWQIGMVLPVLIFHSRTVTEHYFFKQSHPVNLDYHPILYRAVPFFCSWMAISLMLGLNISNSKEWGLFNQRGGKSSLINDSLQGYQPLGCNAFCATRHLSDLTFEQL